MKEKTAKKLRIFKENVSVSEDYTVSQSNVSLHNCKKATPGCKVRNSSTYFLNHDQKIFPLFTSSCQIITPQCILCILGGLYCFAHHLFRPKRPYTFTGFVPSKLIAHGFHGLQVQPLRGQTYYPDRLILLSHDVETNPGPTLVQVQTHNVRGLKNYHKLKRVLNSAHHLNKQDLGIICLQETHIDNDKQINYMWRGKFVLSPSENNARGNLLLYTHKSFDKVILEQGDPDGRTTWLVAERDNEPFLIVGIYGPNHHHLDYFRSTLDKAETLANTHQIHNIYLLGDFNVNICTKPLKPNYVHKDKRDAIKLINDFCIKHSLSILSDTSQHTWQRDTSLSTLDFIIGPKVTGKITRETLWGSECSDHAKVGVTIKNNDNWRGPGLPRVNTMFLERTDLLIKFRAEVTEKMSQVNSEWDPHKILEFLKVIIRSSAFELQSTYRSDQETQLADAQEELNKLQLQLDLQVKDGDVNKDSTARSITLLQNKINESLEAQAKYLAQRARIQWLEKGERNNKYFLNMIKHNERKQRIDSMINDRSEITEPSEIVSHIHEFYNDLYKCNPSKPEIIDEFLSHIEPEVVDDDNAMLIKPISIRELTEIMNQCKGTTPGPDGISTQIYKVIWDIAGPIILNAWNYSLTTGTLAPSQQESAICLLEKKGKDKRLVSNLRPITLSNCDLKFITKLYTKRIDCILNKIIGPTQGAYLSGRQVHDGLRLIDLVKENCFKNKAPGYLVSLDAKKAYDSVSHAFIKATLVKFGFSNQFVDIFSVLYKDIGTKVLVNGILTPTINIERGVKQGDALSCSLFILLMETLNRRISNNTDVSCIKVNNYPTCKVIAYADDIAILTSNKISIKRALEDYEAFSHASGLFINPEKTEILNLRKYSIGEELKVKIYNSESCIRFSEFITICGKTFSLKSNIEIEHNILSKIVKLKRQIACWNKRNLTIEGKILVAKTFGISQTLYTMQNTTYEDVHLKEIEKCLYQFIWNGVDRIKRTMLKKSYRDGGLSAPDIYSIDLLCKLKQTTRCAHGNHPIKTLQQFTVDYTQVHHHTISKNNFIIKGVKALNSLSTNFVHELNSSDLNTNFHRYHADNLAGSNHASLSVILNLNPIQAAYTRNEMSRRGCVDLYDVYKAMNIFQNSFNLIRNKMSPTVNHILGNYDARIRPENIEEKCDRVSKLITRVNIFKRIRQIKVSDLSLQTTHDDNPNPFTNCRNIRHPRERNTQYLVLHNRLFNNERLARFNIIDSPLCTHCKVNEDNDHIFIECTRATTLWDAINRKFNINIDQHLISFGSDDRWLNNIISLGKRLLAINRSEPIDITNAIGMVQHRIRDTVFINSNKVGHVELAKTKKGIIKEMLKI
jgi:hypothetical protein